MTEIYSLDKLMNGAVVERFSEELQKVSDNIMDPNSIPYAKRSITIKLEFKPNKERDIADLVFDVKSTLAGKKPVEGRFIFGRDAKGKVVCGEFGTGANSKQVELAVGDDGDTVLDTKEEFKGLKVV